MDAIPEKITLRTNITTPTFLIKVLRSGKGTKRFHVECVNRKFIPPNPEGNNHFQYCKSHLEVNCFIDQFDHHLLETFAANEESEDKVEEAVEKHRQAHEQLQQQEPQPQEQQPASQPQPTPVEHEMPFEDDRIESDSMVPIKKD
jgi:hypothetical protein